MIHKIGDQYEEWLRLPVPQVSPDPDFEVRRAAVSDFERIYDLIDETWGVKRPCALYEWLYRRNPMGTPHANRSSRRCTR